MYICQGPPEHRSNEKEGINEKKPEKPNKENKNINEDENEIKRIV